MKKTELDLEDLLALAYQQASTVLSGSKAELMPVFALEAASGQMFIRGCPFRNDDQKEAMIESIRQEIQKRRIVRYSFLCEAWALNLKKGLNEFHLRPSKDPRRYEVVIALAIDRKMRKIRQWRILRDDNGVCTGLEQDADNGHWDQFESWIANLLNQDEA
jgi:hypothetical protein